MTDVAINQKKADKVSLEKRQIRQALAIVVPIATVLIGCIVYVIYMHAIVVSKVMVGALVSSSMGFAQTVQGGFLVDGYLAVPVGRHVEIHTLRSGSMSLCSIPFDAEARPTCVGVIERVAN